MQVFIFYIDLRVQLYDVNLYGTERAPNIPCTYSSLQVVGARRPGSYQMATKPAPRESKQPNRLHEQNSTMVSLWSLHFASKAVFSSQIWSAKIHCSDILVFRLYLVIIVQPLTN
jgi:hypothetical protein